MNAIRAIALSGGLPHKERPLSRRIASFLTMIFAVIFAQTVASVTVYPSNTSSSIQADGGLVRT